MGQTKADADNSNLTKTDDITYGGEAFLKKVDIYQYQGLLITYYVRDKSANLTVHYVDQGDGNEFHSYGITTNGQTFDPNIRLNPSKWQGPLLYGTVTNIKGKEQTVSANLSDMPSISAKYRYATAYTCVKVETKNDCKDVYLYYTFNNKVNYVIDFGLPLEIKLTDLSAELGNANITNVAFFSAQYGTLVYDSDRKVITYTLNGMLSEQESFTVEVEGSKKDGQKSTVAYIVTIIPASTVYYEDNFASFTDGTGNAADAAWSIVGNNGSVTEDKSTSKNQALTELGKMSADQVYGHDAAYADSTKLSMGSAHKVTVNANMVKDWTDGSAWPTATFTFKGTGFDVISLTDNNSGAISVKVYAVNSDGTEKQVEGTLVNNYYGYTCKDGKWTVTPTGDNNALYQIPVIKIGGLDYGTYKVVITAAYATYADKTGDNQYSFWLDAIRVYDPMGKDNATYKKDGEGYPQYIKLHDALVAENVENALFIDGAAKADITDYKNYGPNNEVYLANGQAITFNVPINAKIASVQIGAKAPDGSAAQMVVTGGNGLNQELSTATEMYYKIGTAGDSFTITNTGTGILSLTNLKITFTDKPGSTIALSAPTAEEQTAAVMSVRALFAAPEQTFEPEHFTAKWSRNVRKGGTATLTVKASADVESITVNGEEITAYTTKTSRSFWGAKETYHVFTYRVTNAATADYTVCALNADGVASDPITATLTVRPSIRDWWNGIFDKWKH